MSSFRFSRTCLFAGLPALIASAAFADTTAFTITDDATMDSQVAAARTDFLARRPSVNFTRCNLVVLVPGTGGAWKRGSYGKDVLSYPASTVKLTYLASAMYWERITGRAYNYLDANVRPMITVSSNYDTGVVVDAITGQPNIVDVTSTADSRFLPFYNKRLFTENYLGGRGLLEDMTCMNKTYPSNSNYEGAEQVNIEQYRGGNRMKPKLAASLMLEIQKGAIEPGATSYMRGLLAHSRFGAYGPLGWGLPPGTTYENKIGNAYEDLNDIAYIRLPNGKEAIIAVYSNGYVNEDTLPLPYDTSGLGPLAELLIEKLGLDAGNPAKVKVDNTSANVTYAGTWTTGTGARDKWSTDYRYKSGGTGSASVTWNLAVPTTGKYEVCAWFPQGTNRTTAAPYRVNHATGSSTVNVNQSYAGGRWVRLGDYNFNAGSGSVTLTDAIPEGSAKVVLADAVKATLWPVTASDIIVDNANAGFSASANWSTGTSAADKYGADYRYRSTAAVSDAATFSYSLPSAGNYEVYAWWTQGTNRSTTAPYVVTTSAGTSSISRNQQTGGGAWNSLGTFAMNSGANSTKLSCWTTTGFVVVADAIKVSPR
jgi:hypothetical protein